MSAMDLFENLGRIMSGTSGFVVYWGVLIAIAFAEIAAPGRPTGKDLGPRIKVNLGLGLLSAALLSVPLLSEIAVATMTQERGWSLFHRIGVPGIAQVLLTFLIYDLFGYALHRLSHRWPPLWRLHRIHHSDADMDLSTLFRTHPIDSLIGTAMHMALIAALGLHPLGIVLHELGKLLTMGLGHANIAARPLLSRIAGTVFVTPAFHAFHHSAWQPETDSNYGEVLTVWDRLLGTASRDSGAVARFGLGDDYDPDSVSLMGQLKLPFITR